MRGELHHTLHPRRTHAMWAILYLCIFTGLFAGFLLVAGRIRTYSLPTGAIQLHIPYKTYLVGEPITFTIKNQYNSAIYIANDCPGEPLAVYRLEGATWTRIHAKTSLENCHDSTRQVRVSAGGEQSGGYANWPELFAQPGKYRIVAYVEYFNTAPYQDFEVIARPAKPAASANTAAPTTSTRTTTPTTTTPSTATTTTSTTATAPPAPAPLPSKTISVSTGSITVTYSNSTIYVQSISPASGCTYEGGRSGAQVEVTFKCAGSETQITMSLVNGQLVYRVENDD